MRAGEIKRKLGRVPAEERSIVRCQEVECSVLTIKISDFKDVIRHIYVDAGTAKPHKHKNEEEGGP